MANVKPIIEIQVDDSAFARFYALFQQYSGELDAMPETWKTLGEAMGESGSKLSESALTGKEALALAAAQAGAIAEALKGATKAQSGFGHATKSSSKAMDALKTSAQGVGKAISFVAGGILKLAAFGGLGALLGGFGIGELASSAFNQVRQSGRLGLKPGELASFQVNAKQFLDTSALEAAANAQIDITKGAALNQLGIANAQTVRPQDLAFEELEAATKAYIEDLKTGQKPAQDPRIFWAYIQQLGGQMSDVRNAAFIGLAALQAAHRATDRDTGVLGFSKEVGQAWTKLDITFDKAGRVIQAALIEKLAPLAPVIERITDDFVNFIAGFIDSKAFGNFIGFAEEQLQKFADYLESPDFVKGLTEFEAFLTGIPWKEVGATITLMGQEIAAVAQKLSWLIPTPSIPDKTPLEKQSLKQLLWTDDDWADLLAKGVKQFGSDFIKQFQSTPGVSSLKVIQREFTLSGKAIGDAWKWLNSPITAPAGAAVLQTAKEKHVDPILALATAMQESGLNPKSKGDYEHGNPTSFGLFQLHKGGELGNLTQEQAFDPATNAQVALSEFASVSKLSAQEALDDFSRAVRSQTPNVTHAEIMAQAGTPGMYAALAQRPADPLGYAAAVNKTYQKLSRELPGTKPGGVQSQPVGIAQVLKTVDADIAKYGRSWIEHLPKNIRHTVEIAHFSPSERTHPDIAIINRTLKAVLGRRTPKPAHVSITNATSARVAVSVNASAP